MNEKFLPIGTICTIGGFNRQVMITGYFSTDYKGNITVKDYRAIVYPEGQLEQVIVSFNHDEIKSVDYLGYIDDKFKEFNKVLNSIKISFKKEITKDSKLKYEFDANGVVIGVNGSSKAKINNDKPKYEFDADGTVIGVSNVKNPFEVDAKKVSLKADNAIFEKPKKEEKSKYVFDANGIVVGIENKKQAIENPKMEQFIFDENGIVVGVGKKETTEKVVEKPQYQFDEKGIVIGTIEKAKETISFDDLDNKVETNKKNNKPTYKFDANGIVVGQ